MKKTPLLLGLMMSLTAGFTACSNSEDMPGGNAINTNSPILLVGNLENQYQNLHTRALGDGLGTELRFSAETEINIFFKSEKKNGTASDVKMKDPSSATVTTTPISSTEGEPKTKVTYATGSEYFWDDFYGRDAQLSIFAVGVEGKKASDVKTTTNQLAINKTNNNIVWELSKTQTTETYKKEDLLLSNNIQYKSGGTDNRLKHNGSFPTGNLYFHHATSKIIVNLKKGTGLGSAEFANPSITVNNFYTKGAMSILDNSFNVEGQSVADITPIRLATPNKIDETNSYDFSYECLVIPSRNLDTNNQIFTITNTANGNVYNISTNSFNTNSTITDKLTGNIEPAKQYIFNITINKTGIQLTASKMDWDTQTPDGLAPVIVNGSGIGSTGIGTINNPTSFDLYRSKTVDTGYDENSTTTDINYATSATYSTSAYSCTPLIYWPDHTTAYNFRGLTELNESGVATGTHVTVKTGSSKDYVEIKTCKQETGKTTYIKDGTDICMGAPFTKNTSVTPNTITLTEAKKAADGNINLTFYHGLSEIYVQLLTNETTGATNAVNLTNAVVEIENSITDGKYMLGTVKVEPGTTRTSTYSMGSAYPAGATLPKATTASKGNYYRCYAVPQNLNYTVGSDKKYVTFKITCAETDGKTNVYYVDARDVKTTGGTTTTFTNEWKAGNQYVYNVTLLKSGISVTATLIPWNTNVINNNNVIL